ncbi:hypothetical protein ACGFZL_20360 [Streptomyces sp. NPDC048182]|uniref:hypothetical protein n=1 Tax=Streptomyces sp. NPDC048182 TaxID=3365507 RepID=UPI00371CAEF2
MVAAALLAAGAAASPAYAARPGLAAPAQASPAPTPSTPTTHAPLPACTAAEDHTFPLTTRLHGGPAGYEAGGGAGTWYLDLTNTTSRTCAGIHPVVVLVDDARSLTPAQAHLAYDDAEGRPHPVTLETTDRDELIGAFGGEGGQGAGQGFTVGPGATLTVTVRLALAPDAAPNRVTANAAVVQRRGGDGEWVGQSDDYRFRVGTGESATGASDGPVTPSVASTPDGTGLPFADELAGTGLGRLDAAALTAALLVAAGTTAYVLARRRR